MVWCYAVATCKTNRYGKNIERWFCCECLLGRQMAHFAYVCERSMSRIVRNEEEDKVLEKKQNVHTLSIWLITTMMAVEIYRMTVIIIINLNASFSQSVSHLPSPFVKVSIQNSSMRCVVQRTKVHRNFMFFVSTSFPATRIDMNSIECLASQSHSQ